MIKQKFKNVLGTFWGWFITKNPININSICLTSRGATYWFHCFCFPMSRLSGLRMRNFPDLMCLPKSRETKAVKQWRKGQARSQIPVYKAFNMVVALGWKSTTLWVRRGWANFKVKTYGFKKKLFCFIIWSLQKTKVTRLEQLNHLKASYERAKNKKRK